MKETGILFNAEMVRAILDGRKSVTRRVVKPQPEMVFDGESLPDGNTYGGWEPILPPWSKWPYQIGDRLWVRETFTSTKDRKTVLYREDDLFRDMPKGDLGRDWNWTSPRFMPRWASRITLEITNVRVERLREITEEDAEKEGANSEFECDVTTFCGGGKIPESTYKLGFKHLWDKIIGKRGYGWDVNPWVWVISFKRV